MKIAGRTVRFSAPKPTSEAGAPAEVIDPDGHLQQRWTGGASLRTRVVLGVLVVALVTGPLALGLGVLQSVSVAAPAAARTEVPAAPDSGEQAAVSELARQLVVRWLQTPRGQEQSLAGLVDTAGLQLPAVAMTASEPSTAQLVSSGPGLWSVTVGVTVTDATAVPVRRYFQVPVRYTGGAVIAVSLPAPVAAPAVGNTPTLGYPYQASPSDPVSTAAGEFLGALLAGAGDVTRFVSPGTAVAAVTPPPYTGVLTRSVATNVDLRGSTAGSGPETVRVLVTAAATVTAEQVVTVQYALTLTTREGRWEVSSVDPTPLLAAGDATSPLQPTTVPLAPSSTTRGAPPAVSSSTLAPPTS